MSLSYSICLNSILVVAHVTGSRTIGHIPEGRNLPQYDVNNMVLTQYTGTAYTGKFGIDRDNQRMGPRSQISDLSWTTTLCKIPCFSKYKDGLATPQVLTLLHHTCVYIQSSRSLGQAGLRGASFHSSKKAAYTSFLFSLTNVFGTVCYLYRHLGHPVPTLKVIGIISN